jgi:hypothetical protein
MTGWRKRTIMELAREVKMPYDFVTGEPINLEKLEAFAALIREEATAEANARANASWAMMCEKMVAIEREACAKVCDDAPEPDGRDLAEHIRARGQA